jgi:hypothetical protein
MPRSLRSTLLASLLGAALGVGGFAAVAGPPKGGFPPDPPPRSNRNHWIFEMSARGGKISIDRVKPITFDKPAETPRVIGRFALELYIGHELLDRVRFNVPLMGAEAVEGNRNNLPKPRFDQRHPEALLASREGRPPAPLDERALRRRPGRLPRGRHAGRRSP